MPRVAVLNCGNRRSVVKALEHLGAEICPEIGEATHCIIPGVGTMASVMEAIGHVRAELEWFKTQYRPILGICAGMHAFCVDSEEDGHSGLGWWPFPVMKLPPPIPRQGWIKAQDGCMYFSHSYGVRNPETMEFMTAFWRGNVSGCQFHPEKSQANGLAYLKAFLEWTP